MSDSQVSTSLGLSSFLEELQRPLSLLGLPQNDRVALVGGRLFSFCQLLLKWNATLNLTGAKSTLDLAEEHLSDAFVLAHFVPQGAQVVDVGSGGGLPAMPLAILRPDLSVTFVEPRTKRVAFLRTAVRELGVNGLVWGGRIEDWSGKPSVAMSRATFAPEEWVSIGTNLVGPRGVTYALLNEVWAAQPIAGKQAAGFHTYGLPRGQTRTVAWFCGS